MRSILPILAALLCAATRASASDDMTVISNTSHNGKPAGKSTTYLSSDHSRTVGAEGKDTIVDLKAGTMTTIDHRKKTYYTVTKDDLKQMNAAMQERMNTPEGKKGMEMMQKMSAGMADSYDVKKTGQTRKVGAYTCEEWIITMGTMSTTKECVTSEVKYPEHAYEAFKAFGESMRGSSPYAALAKGGEGIADKMKAIKGFPVATSVTTEVMGSKTTMESEVVEVSRKAIPASTWEVPPGYTKVENPMMRAMARHR